VRKLSAPTVQGSQRHRSMKPFRAVTARRNTIPGCDLIRNSMNDILSLAAFLILASAACGGISSNAGGQDSGLRDGETHKEGGVSSLQCRWPRSLDPVSGSGAIDSGVCAAYDHFIQCTEPGGGGGLCVVNDAGESPTCPQLGSSYTCVNKCSSTQYAVICESYSAAPADPACQLSIQTPESGYFCCPCADGGT
jgi:hypothetical protein